MNNLPSYCGLIDARITTSEKDLSVWLDLRKRWLILFFFYFSEENQRLKEQTKSAVAEISDENQVEWKSQCIALQEQLAKHQDKLKKKQDSYLQVQTEKEASLTDFT